MKYMRIKQVKNITENVALLFIIKKMFFDSYIYLGVLDKHYGICFFILLLILISCQILDKKKDEK